MSLSKTHPLRRHERNIVSACQNIIKGGEKCASAKTSGCKNCGAPRYYLVCPYNLKYNKGQASKRIELFND